MENDSTTQSPSQVGIKPNINLTMSWIEEQKMFSMVYKDDEKAVFQILMTPASFEQLAMDMIRTVKNFNLYQAQIYQERLHEEKLAKINATTERFKQLGLDEKIDNKMENGNAQNLGTERTSDKSSDTQQTSA